LQTNSFRQLRPYGLRATGYGLRATGVGNLRSRLVRPAPFVWFVLFVVKPFARGAPITQPRLKTSEFWQNSEVWLRRSALL